MSHPTPPPSRPSPVALCFKLEPYHRNVPEPELLNDLRTVADKLKVPTLTQALYRQHGRFSPLTFTMRFEGWNNALIKARLKPSRHFRVPAKLVIADIRRVARNLNIEQLSGSTYFSRGNYSLTLIYRHFGSWNGALLASGLPASKYHPRISDLHLFQNLDHLWHILGHQPRCTQLVLPHSRFGLTPYQRRFGGYRKALQAFLEWKSNPAAVVPEAKKPRGHTRSINWRLRYKILRRDHFRCRACGRSPATQPNVQLQIDHIKPWSAGGKTIEANLQTLCSQCNIGKCNL